MDEAELITEQAILNILGTLTELNDSIKQEDDNGLANELKAKRSLIMQVLRDLADSPT